MTHGREAGKLGVATETKGHLPSVRWLGWRSSRAALVLCRGVKDPPGAVCGRGAKGTDGGSVAPPQGPSSSGSGPWHSRTAVAGVKIAEPRIRIPEETRDALVACPGSRPDGRGLQLQAGGAAARASSQKTGDFSDLFIVTK